MPALHHSPPPPDTPPPAPSPRHKSGIPAGRSRRRASEVSDSLAAPAGVGSLPHQMLTSPTPMPTHVPVSLPLPLVTSSWLSSLPRPPSVAQRLVVVPRPTFFQRQERAFFAQAGKEIIRVRVQVNLPPDQEQLNSGGPSPRSWHHPSPSSSALPSFSQRPPRSAQVFPLNSQPSPGLRTPPHDHPPPHDDYDDEAWRKPIPYAERRRAGKHTKRVIVRP